MTQETLATFFGWTTLIHFALLILATFAFMGLRNWAPALHARMFGLQEADVRQVYYSWLGAYKLLIFVFALVPWLALKLM